MLAPRFLTHKSANLPQRSSTNTKPAVSFLLPLVRQHIKNRCLFRAFRRANTAPSSTGCASSTQALVDSRQVEASGHPQNKHLARPRSDSSQNQRPLLTFKLPDVPGQLCSLTSNMPSQSMKRFATCVGLNEVASQRCNIINTIAQWRQMWGKHSSGKTSLHEIVARPLRS